MHEPVILSTWSFAQRANDAAWPALAAGGSSLDAAEHVCRVVEADRDVDSVGYGGLPDAGGAVSLDACVMRSPRECGSVCAVRRHLHVATLARRVMERTPFVMLAGEGADAFGDEEGLAASELLSDEARRRWERWTEHRAPVDQSRDEGRFVAPRPVDSGRGGSLFGGSLFGGSRDRDLRGGPPPEAGHDTISVLALDRAGALGGACSTSGTPFKRPGRVGDAPIVGHGLYVDPDHGAAAATGTGELVMGTCGSFLVVEMMRRGAPPLEAVVEALDRIRRSFQLRDEHQVAYVAMDPGGRTASAALRPGFKRVITDAAGTRVGDPDAVTCD